MSALHLLFALLLAWPLQARYPRSPFVAKDAGATEAALMKVRAQTVAAVKGRDPVALSALMTADVRNWNSALLEPGSVNGDTRWGELEMILSQGGGFVERDGERRFCAPYAFAHYPKAPGEMSAELRELTEGDPWVVMGKDVRVHAAARRDSPIIGTLSDELVELQDQDRPDESGARLIWQWVFLPDGKNGYVLDRYVWSRDRKEHVCFSKRAGVWRITELTDGA